MAYIGSSPTKVVSRQSANIFTYTATANQTAFTGADANGNTLACTPSDIMVHMNGIKLEESDYTATTTTVTLGSGAAAGDEVTITAFLTFESADHYTKSAADTRYVNTTGDTMTGALTVDTSTTTNLNVDSANYGGIQFKAAGTDTGYITSYTNGSGAEAMYIGGADAVYLHTGTNHSLTNGTTRLGIDSSGAVTTPSQPFIDCTGSSNSSHSYGQNDIITHFSTRGGSTPVGITLSNGRFTVPVAGRYLFNFNLYSYTTAEGHYRLQILVNGNIHSYAQIEVDADMVIGGTSSGYDHSVMSSSILNLSASDYVEIKTTGAIQYYRGIAHNSLSMMLLG